MNTFINITSKMRRLIQINCTFIIILLVSCELNYCENVADSTSVEVESKTAETPKLSPGMPKASKILIAINIRNKAHYLPYFFGYLERLNYPKNRLGLFIRVDHCVDNSSDIVDLWLRHWGDQYHYIDYTTKDQGKGFPNEVIPTNWTDDRFRHTINLRQDALDTAKRLWADYLFQVDADTILANSDILQDLIAVNKTLAGPLLNCTNSQVFSNYWGDMLESGYYKRSDNYFDIRFRHVQGIFPVPMLHTVLLINMNHHESDLLYYNPPLEVNYTGPIDDVIIFARSASAAGLKFHLRNDKFFGYFAAPDESIESLKDDRDVLTHLRLQSMLDQLGNFTLTPSKFLSVYLPAKSKLGFDEIYVINLDRRPDRKKKMDICFDILGIEVKYVSAVDGKMLNDSYLKQLGVVQLEGYYDPYHKRGLKYGEIGCFLSHYNIWQDMIKNNYERVLLFEDDIRFSAGFVEKLLKNLREANRVKPDWDLIYVGRKRMIRTEKFVKKSDSLVYPDYTYWTLSYIVNAKGARKLLDQNPFDKMVAIDEYLPIMFDKHPRVEWKEKFEPRDLVAISMEPLLVEPTHYTGEPNYISDTEGTTVIPWTADQSNSLGKDASP